MAEKLDLTAPVTKPALTDYRVERLTLHFNPPEGSSIYIQLLGTNGEAFSHAYVDAPGSPTATTLLIALNKMDLSTQSLQRRILARLVADGVLAGSITGSPD